MKIHEQLRVNRSIRVVDDHDEGESVPSKALEFSKLSTGDDYYVACMTKTGKVWAGRLCTPDELRKLVEILRQTERLVRRWHIGSDTFYPWTFTFDGDRITFRAWASQSSDMQWEKRRVRFRLDTKSREQWNVLADNIEEVLR